MTLSESQAMEDFDFLGSDDNILLARFSRASFSDLPEGVASIVSQNQCYSTSTVSSIIHYIYI